MPKKLSGQNSKAVAAKARKEEKAAAEKARAEQLREDALWADSDKHRDKKQVGITSLCVLYTTRVENDKKESKISAPGHPINLKIDMQVV